MKITLELPAEQPLGPSTTFYFGSSEERTLFPSEVAAAVGTLTTSTLLLGYAEAATAEPKTLQNGSDFLNVADIECQTALESLNVRLERARNFPFSSAESAHQLIQEIEAMKALCAGEPDSEAAAIAKIEQIKTEACEGYRDATADAAVLESENLATLTELSATLLNWEALKQFAGTDCGGAGGELSDNLEQEFDEFVEKYAERLDSADFPTSYSALWNELREVVGISAHAALFGLDDAEARVNGRLLARLLDLLREAAYQTCREDDTQEYLADILSGGELKNHPLPTSVAPEPVGELRLQSVPQWATFSDADIEADIQYCASELTLEIWTSLPRELGNLSRTLEGGDTPGVRVDSAETQSPVEGTLVLDGELRAFYCVLPGQTAQYSNDVLVIKLRGQEVERLELSGGQLLSSQEELDLETILEETGIDPELKNTFALEIYREGDACGGVYGPDSFKLFSVDIEFDPKPVLSSVSANPTSLGADENVMQIFTLGYQDQGANLSAVQNEVHLLPDGIGGVQLAEIGTHDDIISGFGAESGSGTWRANVYVSCDYEGNVTKRNTFTLVDAFDQESEEVPVDTAVSYAGCSGG